MNELRGVLRRGTVAVTILLIIFGATELLHAREPDLHEIADGFTSSSISCGVMTDLQPASSKQAGAVECNLLAQGPCNLAVNRDLAIPDDSTDIKLLRLYFNVFAQDDGTDRAVSAAEIAILVEGINEAYLPYQIQFEYDIRFIHDSEYRYINSSGGLFENDPVFVPMLSTYANRPDTQINIYVITINSTGSGFSFASMWPWEVGLLTSVHGVVLTTQHIGGAIGPKIGIHEIGHVFGLLHTHTGVSESDPCGACGEVSLTPDRDVVGDLCSDTPPTPTNNTCIQPAGTDPCFGQPWGVTPLENYMGYSVPCQTEFTPQQSGRMHCWIDDVMSPLVDTYEECGIDTTLIATSSNDTTGLAHDWVSAYMLGTRLPAAGFYNHSHPDPLDDGAAGPVDIGFSFEFYGQAYDSFYVGINGLISFEDTELNLNGFFYPLTIPGSPFAAIVAPLYADLIVDTAAFPDAGIYIYQSSPYETVIEWHQLVHISKPAESITFAVTLKGDGDMLFQYQEVSTSGVDSLAVVGVQLSSCLNLAYFNAGDVPAHAPENELAIEIQNSSVGCVIAKAGDLDVSGTITASDIIASVNYVFKSGSEPAPCEASADVNCSGSVTSSDVIYLVNHVFKSGADPCGVCDMIPGYWSCD
jgi:hypothetical protein